MLESNCKIALLLTFLLLFPNLADAKDSYKTTVDSLLQRAQLLRHEHTDSSIQILQTAYEMSLSNNDTLSAILTLFTDKTINSNLGRYHKAYKKIWQIILLAEQANMNDQLIKAYVQLGRLYGYLDRQDKTLEYIGKAELLIREKMKIDSSSAPSLYSIYYAKAAYYQENNKQNLVEIYLDSCSQTIHHSNSLATKNTFQLLQAKSFIHQKKCNEALLILNELLKADKKILRNYYVLLLSAAGDAQLCLKENLKAIKSYEKALEYSVENNRHLDFSVLIYEKLSKVYEINGDYKTALDFSKKGKEIDFRIFDSRSSNNADLFKIQDELRDIEERQKELLQEKKLTDLENEEKLYNIKLLSLSFGSLFLSLIGFLVYRTQKQKQKSQHRINEELQEKIIREEEFSSKIKTKNEDLVMISNIMSHDLKSPLRTIHSFASLIQKKANQVNLDESIKAYLSFILTSANSMSDLIDDLLTYSRLEIEGINPESIDLNEFVNSISSSFIHDDDNKEKSTFDIGPLPNIHGDKIILKTVFHNLISNGLKYQPNDLDEHIPKIRFWSVQEKSKHDIFIEDNGIGISEDYTDKLFIPFNRYYSKSEYEGTGLGLSMCKRIMQKHSGDISLHSSSVNGSIFKLSFPKNDQKLSS